MMDSNEKAAPSGGQEAAKVFPGNQQAHNITTRRPTKQGRILGVFASGQSLNRFEAERVGDHCLHSTVAKIERMGIRVSRRIEKVPGYDGHTTRVCRYHLDDENRERAASMLGVA